jgi:hypothetical protein
MFSVVNELLEVGARRRIRSVFLTKLYYVKDGRNAWHSTWVNRWYPSSFHRSLENAKRYVEGMRVQGSVFRIIEIPTLAIGMKRGSAFVTELNCTTPLTDYLPPKSPEELAVRWENRPGMWRLFPQKVPSFVLRQLRTSPERRRPAVGNVLAPVMDSFMEHSLFWRSAERRTVVRLLWDGSIEPERRSKTTRDFAIWKSSPDGAFRPLYWHRTEGAVSDRAIKRLLRSTPSTSIG